MKELSIEQKAKRYDEAIVKLRGMMPNWERLSYNGKTFLQDLIHILPELAESEDERTWIINYLSNRILNSTIIAEKKNLKKAIAWLEKKGEQKPVISDDALREGIAHFGITQYQIDNWLKKYVDVEKQDSITKLSEEEQNRFAKGVLTSCAMSFIDYLDAHKYEGKMCVSNGECVDIENAFHNDMWDRLHRYYCKYIDKQGEQKTVSKVKIGEKYRCSNSVRYTCFQRGKVYEVKDSFDAAMISLCLDCFVLVDDSVEQKTNDNVEPKFHVKDWVVTDKGDTTQIAAVNTGYYTLNNGMKFSTSYIDKYWHLWTIQDAKAGDVLYTSSTASNEVFIFKGLTMEGYIECYCSYDSEDKYCGGKYHFIGIPTFKTHPATKEQRDLLFQKIHEAGYEWDAENKELREIEHKPTNNVIEEEKPLLEKFKQAVYDCAWGKVSCKSEGETKEEYAERWANQFLIMVRDWADDYIDYITQQKLRKSYNKGKEDAIKENMKRKLK